MATIYVEPGAALLSLRPHLLWLLGYPDRALEASRGSMTRAHELSHPFTRASSTIHDGVLHLFNRRTEGFDTADLKDAKTLLESLAQ